LDLGHGRVASGPVRVGKLVSWDQRSFDPIMLPGRKPLVATMPPIMWFPGRLRARKISIDDALGAADRCRHGALRQCASEFPSALTAQHQRIETSKPY
jgi:hypothetical protein